MKKQGILTFVVIGLAVGIVSAKDVIPYTAPLAYPEGTAFDSTSDRFLVSSMRQGSIGAVSRDGAYSTLIKDESLVSSVGLLADPKSRRLYVCVSDLGVAVNTSPATQGKLARLVVFDLDSLRRLQVVDLGALTGEGPHFANDVALDRQGNAYVTDSFSPIIYKVTPDGKATVFFTSGEFKGEGFNLNGIVVHPRGYLLVAKYNSGELFKIPLDNPASFSRVGLPRSYSGADGLVLLDRKTLALVQNNGANKVVRLTSEDNWTSARETGSTGGTALDFPTTAVWVGKALYVNNSHLLELVTPDAAKDRKDYSIERVRFPTN